MSAVVSPDRAKRKEDKESLDEWNKVAESTWTKLKEFDNEFHSKGFDVVVVKVKDTHDQKHVIINGRDVTKKPERFWTKCDLCGKFPCKVQRYIEAFICFIDLQLPELRDLPNNEIRKSCYRYLNEEVRGIRGKGNRKKFPRCVERLVRLHFPNPDGVDYMGFMSVEEMKNEVGFGDSDTEMEEWEPLNKIGQSVYFNRLE